VQPGKAINPVVIELLQAIGIKMASKPPRPVSPEMVAAAWRVVTFGCLDRYPVDAEDKLEGWSIPGATGKGPYELRAIRDELPPSHSRSDRGYSTPQCGVSMFLPTKDLKRYRHLWTNPLLAVTAVSV
jgi:hypothetical protein